MVRPAARELGGVLLLIGALGGQLAFGVFKDGVTNDEVLYVPAGYRYLAARDYRASPTHPALGKLVAAIGLAGSGARIEARRADETEMAWAYRVFHRDNAAGRLLVRARAGPVAMALGLALLTWWWARALAGAAAGLFALALAAFHPTVLAHGHLATTDVTSAFSFLLASWSFWRWCLAPGAARAVLVAVAFGLAVNVKLTGWLLLPAFAAALLLERRLGRAPASRHLAHLIVAVATIVPLLIWMLHGLRYEPWPAASVVDAAAAPATIATPVIDWMERMRLLPEAYLEGVRYQFRHSLGGHPAYLLGAHAKTGWSWYFVVALLVKNTPGFLLLLALAGARLVLRRGEAATVPAHHLLLPPVLLFAAVSAGGIQIGERYLLPCYPYLCVLAAGLLAPLLRTHRWLAAAIVVLHAGPALAVAPRGYLTYFNALAGGPGGGHRVLLDSNLDWGQDLPRLAVWMRKRGVASVQLAYHGADDPARLGIAREDLPGLVLYPTRPPQRPFAGVVVVSPNLLYGLVPRLGDPYALLRRRAPDDRAGVFFVYKLD